MNYNTTEQLQIALAYASVKANNETDTNEFLRFVNEMINTLSKKPIMKLERLTLATPKLKWILMQSWHSHLYIQRVGFHFWKPNSLNQSFNYSHKFLNKLF